MQQTLEELNPDYTPDELVTLNGLVPWLTAPYEAAGFAAVKVDGELHCRWVLDRTGRCVEIPPIKEMHQLVDAGSPFVAFRPGWNDWHPIILSGIYALLVNHRDAWMGIALQPPEPGYKRPDKLVGHALTKGVQIGLGVQIAKAKVEDRRRWRRDHGVDVAPSTSESPSNLLLEDA